MKKKVIPATNARAWKGRRLGDSYQAEVTINEIKRDEEFGDNSCDNGDTVLHRRFGLGFFPAARRSGRPWRTMLTAGVAVCHCRVRMGSENVTTSDDVL